MNTLKPYFRLHWFLWPLALLPYFWSVNVDTTTSTEDTLICPYCDLSGKDYSGQDLTNANLQGANLQEANFAGATLTGAIFSKANLTGANFSEAILGSSDLGPTNFAQANLTKTSFKGVDFKNSDLQYATLSCADFSYTDIRKAKFGPKLNFETSGACQLSFAHATLNCEFPQYWEQMDLTNATLPECENESGLAAAYTIERNLSEYACQIYVSPEGADTDSCGTKANPCQSIQQGISRCTSSPGAVLVAYGEYAPESAIQLKSGISLFGGYYNGVPSIYQSVINSSGGHTVLKGSGLSSPLSVHAFKLNGSKPSDAGQASAVITITNSSQLSLSYCDINAASGTAGTKGQAGTKGPVGGNGGKGGNPDGGTAGVSKCSNANGGAGGQRSDIGGSCKIVDVVKCENDVSTSHVYAGGAGGPGSTNAEAKGGTGGHSVHYVCPATERPSPGPAGSDGKNATCGKGGAVSALTAGSFSGVQWTASKGGDGIKGGTGGGGGGGGSGGSCAYCNCDCGKHGDHYAGTAGGGGGAGGCGGTAGLGGQQGGGSFGIVLSATELTLGDTMRIIGAVSGNGGAGGNGATGGIGGTGGNPYPSHDVCKDTGGAGSAGGKGGAGGASGGGAGGNSGPSIGIALVNGASISGEPVYYLGKSGTAGTKGTGGSATISGGCTGSAGAAGASGLVAQTHTYD